MGGTHNNMLKRLLKWILQMNKMICIRYKAVVLGLEEIPQSSEESPRVLIWEWRWKVR